MKETNNYNDNFCLARAEHKVLEKKNKLKNNFLIKIINELFAL